MHFRSLTRSKLARAGVVLGVAVAAIVTTASPASAAVALTITPGTGPANSATGPTVTINTTTSVFTGTPYVSFQLAGAVAPGAAAAAPTVALNACWPTYAAPIAAANPVTTTMPFVVAASSVALYSPTKLYVKVPSLPIVGTAPTKYNVCVYGGNTPWASVGSPGDALVAGLASGYSVSASATVTGVSPISGPARGGTPIVVTGTNLTGATVMLGGVSMTPTIASDGLSFTAITPPHAADGQPVTLSVTTTGGTVNKLAAFTYSNGIVATPNTMPRTMANTGRFVEIQGVGFASLNPANTAGGATPDTAGAHVFLSRGAYNDATIAGHKANPQVSECSDVLVMNDGLLICKVNLQPYTRKVEDATISGTTTLTSPTAAFNAADVGVTITGTQFGTPVGSGLTAAGTTIAAVLSPTTVTLSTAGTNGPVDTTTIGNSRTIASATTATAGGVTTLTAAVGTGLFTNADVGRLLNSTGVSITSITDADTAILSGPLGTDLSAAAATIKSVIPDGAYTLTVVNDGRINAKVNNPNFNQSIISSGATFTIGDYVTTS
ncbi:IPT/TIG domain-containing protein [Dactylosporangium cerinum]|uniref:IPT/TIG domain-containing protein n=1 Tax=Dactylosporangium cerinum TaxID=1434730 RepID=A0ABV9WEE3_9ACTN